MPHHLLNTREQRSSIRNTQKSWAALVLASPVCTPPQRVPGWGYDPSADHSDRSAPARCASPASAACGCHCAAGPPAQPCGTAVEQYTGTMARWPSQPASASPPPRPSAVSHAGLPAARLQPLCYAEHSTARSLVQGQQAQREPRHQAGDLHSVQFQRCQFQRCLPSAQSRPSRPSRPSRTAQALPAAPHSSSMTSGQCGACKCNPVRRSALSAPSPHRGRSTSQHKGSSCRWRGAPHLTLRHRGAKPR